MRLGAKGVYSSSPLYPKSSLPAPKLETQQETFSKECQESHPPPKHSNISAGGREKKKGLLDFGGHFAYISNNDDEHSTIMLH